MGKIGEEFGVKTNAYSHKTPSHKSTRNWVQVKYSNEIFAIGYIVKVGDKNPKGYYNRGKYDMVDGGTGYAVQMAINNQIPVYVFDQIRDKWFRWSYSAFIFIEMSENPKINFQNFAGIGTRQIQQNGIQAIRNVYDKTFSEKNNDK